MVNLITRMVDMKIVWRVRGDFYGDFMVKLVSRLLGVFNGENMVNQFAGQSPY